MKIFKAVATKFKVLGIGAILCGSLFCMSPITAFAGGYDCTCETKCTEDCVDPDCKLCQEDYRNCEGTEPEAAPEEEWGPLTPDGNMNLVDDYGSIEAGGKQFITVTTKNGNFFYIIIDRDDEGNETVHFLNMVDEADLLSLMDEDQVKEYIAVTGKGAVEETTPTVVTPEPTVPEEEETKEPVEVEKKTNVNGIMALILIIALAGAGGYMYWNTTKNSKKKPTTADPDEEYSEDYLKSIPKETEQEEEDNDEIPEADEADIRKAEIQEVEKDDR